MRGNPQALFGKRPTEKDPAKGTSPAVDFTRREAAPKRPGLIEAEEDSPPMKSGTSRGSRPYAWLTGAQLVRASHAAARAVRRRDCREITADEESFTAGVRHAIRSMSTTQVTATSSLEALAAAADSAARAALHTLNLPGRQRHSSRTQKARPKFPHASVTKTTVTGTPQVTVFAPGFY